MPIEFFEIKDTVSLYRVAKAATIIIRKDPFIIIPLYRLTFFLDLRKFGDREISEVFKALRDKMVIIDKTVIDESMAKFIDRHTGNIIK